MLERKIAMEDLVELIKEDDSEYIKVIHKLLTDQKALHAIVKGARIRRDSMVERYGEEESPVYQGAVAQVKYDTEVIEMVLDLYEVEIEEEN